jgi:hypothetical protein
MSSHDALILLSILAGKHFVIDWVIQTKNMAMHKGERPVLLFLHSFEHALVTFVALLFFTDTVTALLLACAELVVHGILDYVKANPSLLGQYTYPNHMFFVSMGLDQLAHHLSYIAIVAFLVTK